MPLYLSTQLLIGYVFRKKTCPFFDYVRLHILQKLADVTMSHQPAHVIIDRKPHIYIWTCAHSMAAGSAVRTHLCAPFSPHFRPRPFPVPFEYLILS